MSTYTHEQDLQRISLGCLYLLAGKALTLFPTTTRAHPSDWVVLSRNATPPIKEADKGLFPFQVPWKTWKEVVLPLLISEETQGLWKQYQRGDLTEQNFVIQWSTLLEKQLEGEDTLSVEPVLLVDGIQRGSLSEVDTRYPVLDPQLAWVEGHQRLEYPEV